MFVTQDKLEGHKNTRLKEHIYNLKRPCDDIILFLSCNEAKFKAHS